MADLTLYTDAYWISPYVFTCCVAMTEKGLTFDQEPVSLGTGEQQRPAFRDGTITGRVPALRDARGSGAPFFLAESSAIVEYLEEASPESPRALPRDVKERARARQVLGWIRSDLDALRAERSTATMFYTRATADLTAAGEAAADKLLRVAEALVPKDRETLFSDGFSIADADLAFMLHRLILNGHEIPARIAAYAARQWARPSVHAFVTRERPAFVPY